MEKVYFGWVKLSGFSGIWCSNATKSSCRTGVVGKLGNVACSIWRKHEHLSSFVCRAPLVVFDFGKISGWAAAFRMFGPSNTLCFRVSVACLGIFWMATLDVIPRGLQEQRACGTFFSQRLQEGYAPGSVDKQTASGQLFFSAYSLRSEKSEVHVGHDRAGWGTTTMWGTLAATTSHVWTILCDTNASHWIIEGPGFFQKIVAKLLSISQKL